jgi:hypothetical protein
VTPSVPLAGSVLGFRKRSGTPVVLHVVVLVVETIGAEHVAPAVRAGSTEVRADSLSGTIAGHVKVAIARVGSARVGSVKVVLAKEVVPVGSTEVRADSLSGTIAGHVKVAIARVGSARVGSVKVVLAKEVVPVGSTEAPIVGSIVGSIVDPARSTVRIVVVAPAAIAPAAIAPATVVPTAATVPVLAAIVRGLPASLGNHVAEATTGSPVVQRKAVTAGTGALRVPEVLLVVMAAASVVAPEVGRRARRIDLAHGQIARERLLRGETVRGLIVLARTGTFLAA